jgi:cytoskeletal protein RodZ
MAIGADLRHARVARNRSLDDISRATKISPSMLAAIETENFDRVPGGLFRRGYLRAYAHEVGLNPDEVVQAYRDEFEPAPPEPGGQQTAAKPARIRLAAEDDVLTRSRPLVELGVIALIAAICFSFVVRSSNPAPPADTGGSAAASPPVAAASDRSVATTGSAETAPAEIKVEMRATGPCWVEAIAGGKRLVARLMNEGDTETVTVRNDVSLRVGDPATLSYTINGMRGRPFGPAGKPAWVQINPTNYKGFLVR